MTTLIVAAAGGAGAVARLLTDTFVAERNPHPRPLGTLAVNVLGSFLLGLLVGLAGDGAPTWLTVAGTGFCGGFTTFSSASVEAARLWSLEGRTAGIAHALAVLVGSLVAAVVGLLAGRWLL